MGKVPQIKPSRANRPRNAFDLSQRHMFTASPGMLLPILSLDLIPHDHVEINAQDFMRTMPMNSAAFMSMRGVYEFYFVPYSHLYHQFDQFITGMKDFRSSFLYSGYADSLVKTLPMLNMKEIHVALANKSKNDIFGFSGKLNANRLLDLLGYGRPFNSKGESRIASSWYPSNVSPFRICAYNKIYFDYYSHDTYEAHDTLSYNLDHIVNSKVKAEEFMNRSLQMRYRNATKDFYTNVRPTPLFDYEYSSSDMATKSLLDGFIPTDDKKYANNASSGLSLDSSRRSVEFFSPANNTSVHLLRSAFALDKLLNVTMRAGKTYAEQIKAHFGYEVDEGRDGKCDYLGGFDSNLRVSDVTQTSGSTVTGVDAEFGGYLGRTTGKAVGSGSGRITYDAKEHGILMCIYSIVPDVSYDSTRIDPFNMKLTRGDFFIPEFENLGMQPTNSFHYTDRRNTTDGWAHGWQLRYSEYKTALDINHGQFNYGEPLSYWTLSKFKNSNTMADFTLKSLKISPNWCNEIFAVNYNGTEVTDCVFGNCYFNIQKVSDMSEDGMPRV